MKRKKAAVMPASSNAVGAITRLLTTLRSPSKGGEEEDPSVHVHVVPPVEHATAEPGTGSVAARGSQIRLQLEDMDVSEAEPSPPLSFVPTPKPLAAVTSTREPGIKIVREPEIKIVREQGVVLVHTGKLVQLSDLAQIKRDQRGQRGLWRADWAFPGQLHGPGRTHNALDRLAVEQPPEWNCHGCLGCACGDCASQLKGADVLRLREEAAIRCQGLPGQGKLKLSQIVQSDLFGSYDRNSQQWNTINVQLDAFSSVKLCPSAYGLLMGLTGTTFYDSVVKPIQDGTAVRLAAGSGAKRILSNEDRAKQRTLDYNFLSAYVRDLVNKHEQQPAPGAAAVKGETVISKTSWKEKWKACVRYFDQTALMTTPGSQSMLKRVWKVPPAPHTHTCPHPPPTNLCCGAVPPNPSVVQFVPFMLTSFTHIHTRRRPG